MPAALDARSLGIYGRDDEIASVLSGLAAAGGASAAVRIMGPAGAGKTTIWQACVDAATRAGADALLSRPAESEANLSFAGLRDLIDARFEGLADRLPDPQRQALGVALLRKQPGDRPERSGAVEAAVLRCLHLLALVRPVLVAIDDEQWLDRPTRRVVEFAARRLGPASVAFITTSRTGTDAIALPGVTEIDLGPLSLGAIHAALRDRLGVSFPRPLLRRLHDASGGNPFVALEIGRLLLARPGALRATDELPIPDDVRQLVERRLRPLPAPVRRALTIAAALSEPTVDLVLAAGGGSLRAAEAAGIVSLEGPRVRFSHPLFASSVYRNATPASRHRIHARLASLAPSFEERARHRALAATGPDEAVASEVERAAEEAFRRGAVDAAVELVARACDLTPPAGGAMLHRRRIAQAEYCLKAGDTARAREVADAALAVAEPGTPRAEALFYRGRAEMFGADWRLAEARFEQAASEPGAAPAIQARIQLAFAQLRTMSSRDPRDGLARARRAGLLAEQSGRDDILCEALSIQAKQLALIAEGDPEALLRQAAPLQPTMAALWVIQWPIDFEAAIREWQDDLAAARAAFEEICRLAEERGDESSREWTLWRLAHTECLAGAWPAAIAHLEEGRALAIQARRHDNEATYLGMLALVQAHLGDAAAREHAALASAGAPAENLGTPDLLAHRALGLLELSLGNPSEAHRHLAPLIVAMRENGIREPGATRFVADAIEALAGLGRIDEAWALLADLQVRAERLDRPSALAAAGRCRGLLLAEAGSSDEAIAELQGALVQHDRVTMPFERARTLLALGRVARRSKARRLARDSLVEAGRIFGELGASIWTMSARDELARIPGRGPSVGELTPTEARVAELLADGRSTAQVAAALFVTPKTVETYTTRIYAKLDVHSRAGLVARVAGRSRTEPTPGSTPSSMTEAPPKL